jgi:multidrug efflux pump
VRAIREQNVQVSAGQLGAEPTPKSSDFLVVDQRAGTLQTEEEFGQIVVESGAEGEIVRLADVGTARARCGRLHAALAARQQGCRRIPIFEAPGANAIELSDAVRAKMAELATRFPQA